MTSVDVKEIAKLIQDRAGHDGLAGRLLLAALVSTLLREHGYQPIVVGGPAVDTYVAGGFGTSESLPSAWEESLDVDTVVIRAGALLNAPPPRQVLEQYGFKSRWPHGGSLQLDNVPFPVDFVGDGLPDEYSPDHVTTVHLEEADEAGLVPPQLAGPEDILFDYMESGWHMHHQRDWARALAIAAVMDEHLDLGYLFAKAHWRKGGAYVEPLEHLLAGEPLQMRP